jgi:pimeloyl-ACP methyl ester carboxylesterase
MARLQAEGTAEDIPVLLVHGFAGSFERTWHEPGWSDLLSDEGRSVIGVDVLGHGQAPKPGSPAAYASLEQSILTALPARGPADAVGFSLGAELVLRAAAALPGRFRRIVLAGISDGVFAGGPDPEPIARAIETGEAGEQAGPVAAALLHFAVSDGNDRTALAACLRRPRTPLTAAQVAAIEADVLVVLGERDFGWPADRLVAALAGARLVALPGTDHYGTVRDFRFVAATLDFLRAPGQAGSDR